MRRILPAVIGLCFCALGVGNRATAGPIVGLKSAADFAAALLSPTQNLRPISNPIDITTQNKIFPGLTSTTGTTVLYANTAPINGMVSATGNRANLNRALNGGYVYDYKLDPDLSNYFLHLELFLPEVGKVGDPGIDMIGIALTDHSGNAKIWGFDHTALTAGVPETFLLKLSDGLGAGGSTSFFMDPGFDLSGVQTIQVADEGLLTTSFPPPPPADAGFPPAPDTALWFGTEQFVTSVPEPSAALFFIVGVAAIAAWRGRRRIVQG